MICSGVMSIAHQKMIIFHAASFGFIGVQTYLKFDGVLLDTFTLSLVMCTEKIEAVINDH